MRVLWWWIPFIVLYAGYLNLARGTFTGFVYKIVVHSLFILGFVILCDKTYLNFKTGDRKTFAKYLVLSIICILFLNAGYFIFETVAICPQVELGGQFYTNKITGSCKYGVLGLCDEGNKPWYMERGCDASEEEKFTLMKESDYYYEKGVERCKNYCDNLPDGYCDQGTSIVPQYKCQQLYNCPTVSC